MSIVPMSWLLDISGQYPVLVSIYHGDGSVVISHGGIEMGQGINTKVNITFTHILNLFKFDLLQYFYDLDKL